MCPPSSRMNSKFARRCRQHHAGVPGRRLLRRHHDLEPLFNEQTIAEGLNDFAFRDELMTLWQLANACEGRRGKASAMQGQHDYNFRIDGDLGDAEACRVDISARKRGSPRAPT